MKKKHNIRVLGKYKYISLFLAFAFIFFFHACKDKTLPAVDVGYEYFPVEIGHWVEYEVDSVVYDDFTGTIDTFQFYIRELYESEFVDNQGRPTIRIERYYKDIDTANYVLKDIWYANKTNTTAEKVEENYRYIKLAFPIKETTIWDANATNVYDALESEYRDMYKAKTINTLQFDSTITAYYNDETTLISEDYHFEVYAKDVGMIRKNYVSLDKVWDSFSQSWVIESGVIVEYNIIDYKNN